MIANLVKLTLLLSAMSSKSLATKTVLHFNEEERVKVKISNKSMNRIHVEGDRISEIIGVNESVAVEKDAQHGNLFLKVTEGSHDKIEITILTEGGLVQDLTLEPVEKGSSTIVLKTNGEEKSSSTSEAKFSHSVMPTMPLSNTSYQDGLIEVMRVLFTGRFVDEGCTSTRSTTTSASVQYGRGVRRGGLVGEVFEISNPTSEEMTLQERDFYQPGDLALAMDKKSLKAGQKAILYVVRREA